VPLCVRIGRASGHGNVGTQPCQGTSHLGKVGPLDYRPGSLFERPSRFLGRVGLSELFETICDMGSSRIEREHDAIIAALASPAVRPNADPAAPN
jgi:hypothetical protein